VRGVNALEIRVPWSRATVGAPIQRRPPAVSQQGKMIAWYVPTRRLSDVRSAGGAQVGCTSREHDMDGSAMRRTEADRSTTKLGGSCLTPDRLGYFDEQSLSSVGRGKWRLHN